ncbi:C-reactive protein [Bombina bombina]|uniref:C-reactive protein n=1 Tax=Bombina bombina TaxID=8345 RepID=UPI00235AC017|nr:C-reactive protein [Bombina bombina]
MNRIVLWTIFFVGAIAQRNMDGNVFLFPKETSTAYVILLPTITKPLVKLSFCLRSYTELSRDHPLISLATHGKDNAFIIYPTPPVGSEVHIDQEGSLIKTNPDTLDWKHTCVTWDSDTGVIQLWINGKLYPRKVLKKGFSIDAQTSIILGQEQDSFGGGFDIKQSFVGEITDVHMWDYVLQPKDIHKVLVNDKNVNGNVISWRTLQYDIKGEVFVQPKLQCISEYSHKSYSQCNEDQQHFSN